jgi:hypothetical protein
MRLICIAASVALTATPISGHSSTLELAVAVNKTLSWNRAVVKPPERRTTALAQQAYWKSFSHRLPRLPPNEKAWLEEEMNAGNERFGAVLERKEFALWSLALRVDGCLDSYDKLLKVIGTDREWEAYYWVKTLNCYREMDDFPRDLLTAGLSNGRADGALNFQMLRLWENYIINRVLENVLLRE